MANSVRTCKCGAERGADGCHACGRGLIEHADRVGLIAQLVQLRGLADLGWSTAVSVTMRVEVNL